MIDKRYITMSREPFYEIVKKYVNSNSVILDVGCGNASFAEYLGRDDVYLLDSNENTVLGLLTRYKNVKLGKSTPLPFDNDFFDIIHSSHMIEHLYPNDLYNFIKECKRCLKRKGLLCISTPMLWDNFYGDLTHIKPYNFEIFLKYLVSKESSNRTENLLGGFELLEHKKRYYLRDMEMCYSETIIGNVIAKIFNTLRIIFKMKVINVNGYTIILKKISNSE